MFRINYVEFKKEVHEAIDHGYPPEEIKGVIRAIQKKHRVDVDLTSRSLLMAYIIGHPKAAHDIVNALSDKNWAHWVYLMLARGLQVLLVFVAVGVCVLILKLFGLI